MRTALFLTASLLSSGCLAAEQGTNNSSNEISSFGHNSAVISVYHHVSDTTPASTSISPAQFERHLEILKEQQQPVISLPKLLDDLEAGSPLPEKAVAITFDDGYESIYTTAFPLLMEAGLPFTVFISTGPIDRSQRGYMTWDQLREMVAAGVTIGNHGTEHASLLELSDEEIRNEIVAAQTTIDRELGPRAKIFAYPYGEFSLSATSILRDLGYRAFAQNSGAIGPNSNFQALPRFPLAGIYAEEAGVRQKYLTLAFATNIPSPIDPISTSDAPMATLSFGRGNYHDEGLNCFDNGEILELERNSTDDQLITLKPIANPHGRRWHYICTAREIGSSRYYWYSQPWFNPQKPQ